MIFAAKFDRSALARQRRKELLRPGWIGGVVAESKQYAASLESCTAAELAGHTDRLRRYARLADEADQRRVLVLGAAAIIESIRRTLGYRLFDTQLHAGIVVSRGAVAEMQTGEGKTLSIALPAYLRALPGRGVHVATPNSYLAARDHDQLAPVFRSLGMTVGLLADNADTTQTRAAYHADITYGPGHAFGFDYLRDQLTLERFDTSQLGQRLVWQVHGDGIEEHLLQRGLQAAIVDEIDHVLIDDAVSPLLLSGGGEGESPDADVHRAAGLLAERLECDTDYQMPVANVVQLTDAGFAKVYRDEAMAVHGDLIRPWHQYVVLALRARHCYRRDVHYVVRDSQVQIVDAATGRIMADRSWSDGLHQAVEAREGLQISCEKLPLARITRQRFYRYYRSLAGTTGTATGCESELAAVYGLPICVVPLRTPSRRVMLPDHVSLDWQEKLAAIGTECAAMIDQGRAVLVGTLSIAESIEIAAELAARGLEFQLLNGVQDAAEAAVIARAGRAGAITVATNLAGRGTDIALAGGVAQRGGLHVIVSQQHSLSRVDRQLIGRCARCGDPGSARVFLSADDAILHDHAPWIARAIRRWDRRRRRDQIDFGSGIRAAQSGRQRAAAARRWQLLQADQEDERLLSQPDESPQGCCAL